jgi:hypothetical protein
MKMSHNNNEGAVRATLRFINDSPKWDHEKPYLILRPDLEDECPPTNIDFVERTCIIKDLRCTESETSLHPDFFKLVDHESQHLDSLQQEDNSNPYMHETVDLLKGVFQTDCVIAYNTRVQAMHRDLKDHGADSTYISVQEEQEYRPIP